MKKSLHFIAVLLFFSVSFLTHANSIGNEDDLLRKSCFTLAREFTIMQEGEINIDNVQHVLDLTEYLRSIGACD